MTFTYNLNHFFGKPPKGVIQGYLERFNHDLPGKYTIRLVADLDDIAITEVVKVKFGKTTYTKKLELRLLAIISNDSNKEKSNVRLEYRHEKSDHFQSMESNWITYRLPGQKQYA